MKIYIACLKKLTTGGIELLHQLCHELDNYEDIDAYIWFEDGKDAYIPDCYKEYKNRFVVDGNPDKDIVLIFPEVWVSKTFYPKYAEHQKVIFFMSVDYYVANIPKNLYLKFPKDTIFMSQSWFAYWYLQGKHIESIYVTDYLNDEYMTADLSKPRVRQILYNPKKGLEVTKRIMAELPNEKFIPIQNMSVAQVKSLMEESMLYIDFGNHPGKDRIPREAAMCGCCVITNREGSAAYYEDVSIPEPYRNYVVLSDYVNFFAFVADRIRYVLNNYDLCVNDFDVYQENIRREKTQFKEGVRKLVNRLWKVSI